ncbi:PREDICTED: olfactory receptor 52K2-like [Thamnophis sirtalis]|uniref:Olfactory receptor 52K2-like n=1 Tax=Thamnophis sirtalis TaxID=35019 RepID=A0A6I9XFF4_9SAUR|nr:PREDICTED: olfactory receptor 52K2-like [Thamnophis sirtalis]
MGNLTYTWSFTFVLQGIPGLEEYHLWFSLAVCTGYVITIAGNSIILLVVVSEAALHRPMYYFLCMLSAIDLAATTSTLPKMLSIFWFQAGEIQFNTCLAQMFFIHALCMMESAVLLAMAVDRYVAICFPLRYNSFFTGWVIGGDLLGIGLSYFFIVRAVLRLSSNEARLKAFGTCGSHLCVITISYSPALFSFLTHRFGHNVAPHVHILLANFYLLVPPMLNPIVYGVRTKEIREQVIRVLLPNKAMVKSRTL